MASRICPTCDELFPVTQRICPDDGDVLFDEKGPSTLSGELIAGRYLLGDQLGHGAMGAVYEADDIRDERAVAVKVLRPERVTERAIDRLRIEAQAARAIEHEGVVRVLDQGGDEASGRAWLVMERLRGHTLDVLRRAGKLADAKHAVEILAQVADIIGFAHDHKIIHRDLKPSNILVHRPTREAREVKVLDFGIAKVLDPAALSLTPTGQFVGTPNYVAPEQASEGRELPASDVYSLGVVLFEALTGRLPFRANGVLELLRRLIDEPAPPLSAFKPDVPPDLEEVVDRCLRKTPERRYRDGHELAEALRGVRFDPTAILEAPARPRSADPASLVGTSLDGHYTLEEWLGPGRFGSQVFRATHRKAGTEVAVRVWRARDAASRDALISAFRTEARAMTIRHSNLIAVLDFGFDDDQVWLVTEYIHSRSLRELIDAERVLAPERVVRLFRPVISAMKALHDAELVSGGLTPGTIRVGGRRETERLYVSPFGLSSLRQAHLLRQSAADREDAESFFPYLSPEQRKGASPDTRSDLWTLARVLVETLRGNRSDPTDPGATKTDEIDIPSMGELRELGLGPAWRPFLERALAAEPSDRFPTAEAMLLAVPDVGAPRGR